MKTTWPTEVSITLMSVAGHVALEHHQLEKLRAHINRLLLSETSEEVITYEVSLLAEAMEEASCAV